MAGWFRKTSWGGISGLASMTHKDSGRCGCPGRRQVSANAPATMDGPGHGAWALGVGQRDEEPGNLCSLPANLSWTLGRWGPSLLPPGNPQRCLPGSENIGSVNERKAVGEEGGGEIKDPKERKEPKD